MVHVMLIISRQSIWSMDDVVNTFPKIIEREQTGLKTVIHSMPGLTIA